MSLPTIHWGIIGTGQISDLFVKDLVLERDDAPVKHVVKAVGSSSLEKGRAFVKKSFEQAPKSARRPTVYASYNEVYQDPDVDIVYIGTPHAMHRRDCLDAIAAGKHVLCEKPFTINAREAEDVINAAKTKGVFIMEAVWTRFLPIMSELHERLHGPQNPAIGTLQRLFCDFGLAMDIPALSKTARVKNPALGAGALLDIGMYGITLASVLLNPSTSQGTHEGRSNGDHASTESSESCDDSEISKNSLSEPHILSNLVIQDGIDIAGAIIMRYNNPSRMAILSTSLESKTPEAFLRIEGSHGHVVVEGISGSLPRKATITSRNAKGEKTEEVIEPKYGDLGLYFEADAVALDVLGGRKENDVMPTRETLKMMKLLDRIRRENGLKYPQDK